MLQWINDRMKVIGWIFILPLALVFAVWGVQGIVDFSTRKDRGLKVNGEDLDLELVRQNYQQRLAQLSKLYPRSYRRTSAASCSRKSSTSSSTPR